MKARFAGVIRGNLLKGWTDYCLGTAAKEILNKLKQPIVLVSSQGNILDANRFACDLIGRAKEDLISRKVSEVFHSKTHTMFGVIKRLLSDKVHLGEDFFIVDQAGRKISLSIAVLKVADNFLVLIRDISENTRAQREKELMLSISRVIRDAEDLEGMCSGIVDNIAAVVDMELCKIYIYLPGQDALELIASRGVSGEMYKNTRRYIVGDGTGSVASHTVASGQTVIINDVANHPLLFHIKEEILRLNHKMVISVPLLDRGETQGVLQVVSLEDVKVTEEHLNLIHIIANELAGGIRNRRLVRELKENNLRLEQSRRKYMELFDGANDMILIHDDQGNIQDANKAALKVTGYTKEQITRKNLADIGDYTLCNSPTVSHSLETKGEARYNSRLGSSRKGVIPVEISSRIVDFDGNRMIQSIARDISDRVRQRRKLIKANKELKEKNYILYRAQAQLEKEREKAVEANILKTQFLANMTHELKTPLNAILGFAYQAESDLDRPDRDISQIKQDLRSIVHNGEHLLRIISDILDISRIEAKKLELNIEEFNLRDCIESTMEVFRQEAAEKGIELAFKGDKDKVMISDAMRIKQILINLVSNAVKFTPSGGQVELSTSGSEGFITIKVRDTGIGIEQSALKHIFESFRQADGSITRKYGGSGLGLAIAKQLAEKLGGGLEVESHLGQGTTFSLCLPVIFTDTAGKL